MGSSCPPQLSSPFEEFTAASASAANCCALLFPPKVDYFDAHGLSFHIIVSSKVNVKTRERELFSATRGTAPIDHATHRLVNTSSAVPSVSLRKSFNFLFSSSKGHRLEVTSTIRRRNIRHDSYQVNHRVDLAASGMPCGRFRPSES